MEIGAKAAILQATAAQAAKPGKAAPDAAQTAAREFEAEFLAQVVEEMMSTVKEGSFGGGHGEELWRSFLSRAYADEIASRNMTGLSKTIEQAISAYRESSRKDLG